MSRKFGSKNRKSKTRKQAVRDLKSGGLTYKEIGKVLGICPNHAQRLIKIPRVSGINKCSKCGIESKKLHYHHVDYSNDDSFLILCQKCHRDEHSNDHVRQSHLGKFKTKNCKHCDGSGREMDHVSFGSFLRSERKKTGRSMTFIAGILNVSKAYLHDLEFGRRRWNEDLIQRYHLALKQ